MVRPFDLRLPSNRFVLLASVLALVGVVALRALIGAPTPVGRGGEAGFTVLLSWALARELDPDEPASATVAAFAGLLILPTGTPSLGVVTTLLFAIRVVTRTTGGPPSGLDLLWLAALAGYSARASGGFLSGLALALALAWDSRRSGRSGQALCAIASAALAVGAAASRATLAPHLAIPTRGQWVVLGAGLVSLPWVLRVPPPVSVDDRAQPLSARRLDQARLLAVGTGAATIAWIGGAAAALVGLWAAFVGIAAARALRPRRASAG